MIPAELIKQKRDGQRLTKLDLKQFVQGYVDTTIPEYQMAALLMAIYFNGMEPDEINSLVEVMIESGDRMDFSDLEPFVADKHSTGGVGDTVSLVLGPLMAAAGLAIPMISGRSLGHTGGTLDKLESIPGFNVNLSLAEFHRVVRDIGICMIGQTGDICPADRMMYALRDVTGTVESIPLICGSIMSKKIAEGIQGLVLDVKCGNGAFMKDIGHAQELGSLLKVVGESFHVKTDVVHSSMNQPLGRYAGVWCEVEEALSCLNGNGPKDTMDVTLELGAHMLVQSGSVDSNGEAITVLKNKIENGSALSVFYDMVNAQGGNPLDLENPADINRPQVETIVRAGADGFITSMDTYKIGLATVELGCGRKRTDDVVDPTSGIEFYAKIGDEVKEGSPVFRCFNSDKLKLQQAVEILNSTVRIGAQPASHQLFYAPKQDE